MEFHYSELMPADHLISDPYTSDYVQTYMLPNQGEAEYQSRSSVLVDGGDRFGVSAVVFDKYEELIWMGNQGGHVTSYYGPNMQKYTSFQVHQTEEVRDIISMETGIYVLTKSMLRFQIRRGIPKYTHKSGNMQEMQCLYEASKTKLLMGGHQDKLLEFDIPTNKETAIPITEDGCAVLRSGGGSIVACGSANGSVTMRDLRCPGSSQHNFQAHTACLSDLDMQGDMLISCGFTQSNSGDTHAEQYVLVWDVRQLKGGAQPTSWMANTASVPLLLHFLPAFSGRAVAMAGDGHVTLLHVKTPEDKDKQSVFQIDTQSSVCSAMDVSSTSQALAFGTQNGHLHLFSPQQNREPVYNGFSRDTEFADPHPELPVANFNDKAFRFSSIQLPPLTSGRWFNELPADFYKKVYRKPKPVDTEVLKTMKMQGPIGYAPNPGNVRRNQMPYVLDTLEDLNPLKNNDSHLLQPIPKHYQKLDIRLNKQNANDTDINKTGFPGLEATLPNSYCNAMLQVLYYTSQVKTMLLAHTCAKEFCLSCELGFLFRMLDTTNGAPCQATNFLRAFRTVPEAAALGLILPDRGLDHRVDLIALIQSWNRFILHQLHYEIVETRKKEKELTFQPKTATSPVVNGQYEDYNYSELEFLGPTQFETNEDGIGNDGALQWKGQDEGSIPPNPADIMELPNNSKDNETSEISQLFAIGRHQLNRCLKCNKEEERESVVMACALQYPPPSNLKENGTDTRTGFIELLLASLASRRSTPAWCENCRKFSPTLQQGRAIRLPSILAINFGGVTAHEKAYWCKGVQKDMPEGNKRGASGKPCRYGLSCARPGCRFKHPDRPGSSAQMSPTSPVRETHCVLPYNLSIRLSTEGDITINDKPEQSTDANQNSKPENGIAKGKKTFTPTQENYTLTAAVVCVEDNPKNLVAYVRVGGTNDEPFWYMFNDLCITPIPIEETLQFSQWWKTPCVLFYTSDRLLLSPQQDILNS